MNTHPPYLERLSHCVWLWRLEPHMCTSIHTHTSDLNPVICMTWLSAKDFGCDGMTQQGVRIARSEVSSS